jgi:predicted nucleotidyltransferase
MTTTTTLETRIPLPIAEIGNICRRLAVVELAVFGSILRADFGNDSDVDFLVTFHDNDAGPWGYKLTELAEALEKLLSRPVDVLTRKAVEESPNYIRRRHILQSAKTIYVA